MIKVYIAGKITGDPNYKETFAKAAKTVADCGNIPLNPAELPEGMAPADYMRICLAMIDICDFAYFLPGWEESPGAQLELNYCKYTGKMAFCFGGGEKELNNFAPAKARRTLRDFLKEAENT